MTIIYIADTVRHARLDRASLPSLGGFSALDFVYGENALNQMESDIAFCRSTGAAGVVVGKLGTAAVTADELKKALTQA